MALRLGSVTFDEHLTAVPGLRVEKVFQKHTGISMGGRCLGFALQQPVVGGVLSAREWPESSLGDGHAGVHYTISSTMYLWDFLS